MTNKRDLDLALRVEDIPNDPDHVIVDRARLGIVQEEYINIRNLLDKAIDILDKQAEVNERAIDIANHIV